MPRHTLLERIVEERGTNTGRKRQRSGRRTRRGNRPRSARRPIRLAGGVAVDLLEPEGFEPPRGSCAHVSKKFVAVDDERAVLSEPGSRGEVQLLQRNV